MHSQALVSMLPVCSPGRVVTIPHQPFIAEGKNDQSGPGGLYVTVDSNVEQDMETAELILHKVYL